MNTYIFLYPETSFFEVNLVAYFMKTQGNVWIVSEKENRITTNEGIKIVADITLDQMRAEDADVFVVCGGNIENIIDMSALHHTIRDCMNAGKIIGGICAGRDMVRNALALQSRDEGTQVIENRIILSPGNEYVDFALEIGRAADIYADEADYQETVSYFKEFKEVLG